MNSHKLSRITKVCYLAAAVAILALTSTVVAAEVQQSFASSEPTTIQTATSTKTISMINLNFLNASEAKQYNIHGLVTIGSSSPTGINVSAIAGQTVQVSIDVSFVAFDSSVTSVTVSYDAAAGQVNVGSLDVSSFETFYPSTITVNSGQTVTTTLYVHIPLGIGPVTFRPQPQLNVSPNHGVAILFKNDVNVSVEP